MASDVKWIQLDVEFFNNKKIKALRKMPSGCEMIVIWFELLALAGQINDGGYIYFSESIPYTDQLLAAQFDFPISTIQLALATFAKFEMIEIINDIILVSNWTKYQNETGLAKLREQNKERQKRHREKLKALGCGEDNVTCNVTNNVIPSISYISSSNNLEDKDKGCGEKEKKPKKDKKAFVKPTVDEVAAYCRERGNSIDAEAFVAHYESNGWMVGKNPMQNWKMAVVTWEKNNMGGSKKASKTGPKSHYNSDGKYDYESGESGDWESL